MYHTPTQKILPYLYSTALEAVVFFYHRSLLLSGPFPTSFPPKNNQKTFWLLVTFLLVTFPWLLRGSHLLRKTVLGRFPWLFLCFFFVAFPWPSFWANFTRTRPGKALTTHTPLIKEVEVHPLN